MLIWIFSSTKPAPLIMALKTSHMIASFIFLYSNFAFWTVTHISILLCPFKIFFIHCLGTFHISMPLQTTIKAYFLSALTFNFSLFTSFHKIVTIRFRTPFKIWIFIYIYVLFKSKIFIINFLWSKKSDFISSEFFFASILRTFYLGYLSIGNIEF